MAKAKSTKKATVPKTELQGTSAEQTKNKEQEKTIFRVILNPSTGMWGFDRRRLLFGLGEVGVKEVDISSLSEDEKQMFAAALRAGELIEAEDSTDLFEESDELTGKALALLSFREDRLLKTELDAVFGKGSKYTVGHALQLARACIELEQSGKGPLRKPRPALLKRLKGIVVFLQKYKKPTEVNLSEAYENRIEIKPEKRGRLPK